MIYSIYIDMDYDYSNLENKEFREFLKQNKTKAMKYMMSKYYLFKKVYIRKSANNHIHLRFDIDFDLSYYTSDFILDMMIFRALLKDDPYRISLDLQRLGLSENRYQINRIFDTKTVNYKTKKAGKWLEFDEVVK